MSASNLVAVILAGAAAGTINAVVGSGTLITFPVLLALGYPPVLANMSNNVGLVPGNAAAVVGYRREMLGLGRLVLCLGVTSVTGAVAGAILLLTLTQAAFKVIVIGFIGIALVLFAYGPRLRTRLDARRVPQEPRCSRPLTAGVLLCGVYGGYFGASQGVILLAVLGTALSDRLQRLNALKNVLALTNNTISAITFVVFGRVDWAVAEAIAGGALVGGLVGSTLGRRLPESALRILVLIVGSSAIIKLLTS